MKEQMLYVCELCGTSYSDKKKAEECEAGHAVLKKAKIVGKYKSIKMVPDGMPVAIEVTFSDGRHRIYR